MYSLVERFFTMVVTRVTNVIDVLPGCRVSHPRGWHSLIVILYDTHAAPRQPLPTSPSLRPLAKAPRPQQHGRLSATNIR